MPEYYKIEQGVPFPEKIRPESETLRQMEIGDSYLRPKKSISSLRPQACRLGLKIKIKPVSETEVRVWRTA